VVRNASVRGNDLSVYINGTLFGVINEIRWEQSYGRHAIHGIDSVFPFELASGQAMLTGSMSLYRLHNSAGLEGAGVVPRDHKLPRERYFSLQVVDNVTDTVVMQCDRAAVMNQSWNVASTQILQGSFSFMGIGWANEFGEE
jgi:hypothetical protein